MRLDKSALPEDWQLGHFALRLMGSDGPMVVGLALGAAYDLTPAFATSSAWLNSPNPLGAITARGKPIQLDLEAALANSHHATRDPSKPYLLAPIDLQAVKACGVTYVRSMLERVIEERCRGDASRAEAERAAVRDIIGDDLANLVPGSEKAMQVKAALVEKGWWSQYLEVGIGPDAEIFTKAQPLSSVGTGALIGVHPTSHWNNPEPEAVLAIAADGRVTGAMLGNDVNLRDVEGRSALLLGRAKDNNAASALGPMIRLFDGGFTLDDIRKGEIRLTIQGKDGFLLDETGRIGAISRDPADLARQLVNPHHQYPDGAVLYLGTPFSPTKDRGAPGQGFTHHPGDVVTISSPRLGALSNEVAPTDACPPWQFGTGALMANLARRGLLPGG
ncbi:fumarylacetoacetate hydrolase family protein [Acetobacteraceae bacterium H6797]|nr:fumarylacetoacetate hydrolase family protein [Acetobacteraceae bacterium H6797]